VGKERRWRNGLPERQTRLKDEKARREPVVKDWLLRLKVWTLYSGNRWKPVCVAQHGLEKRGSDLDMEDPGSQSRVSGG
jgi:hypothetical protein